MPLPTSAISRHRFGSSGCTQSVRQLTVSQPVGQQRQPIDSAADSTCWFAAPPTRTNKNTCVLYGEHARVKAYMPREKLRGLELDVNAVSRTHAAQKGAESTSFIHASRIYTHACFRILMLKDAKTVPAPGEGG